MTIHKNLQLGSVFKHSKQLRFLKIIKFYLRYFTRLTGTFISEYLDNIIICRIT